VLTVQGTLEFTLIKRPYKVRKGPIGSKNRGAKAWNSFRSVNKNSFSPPSGHITRDGGRVLSLPMLLLSHVASKPEGHVRPLVLPSGEQQHSSIPTFTARFNTSGCGLFFCYGEHRASSGTQVCRTFFRKIWTGGKNITLKKKEKKIFLRPATHYQVSG
jgi:hypothetical protein